MKTGLLDCNSARFEGGYNAPLKHVIEIAPNLKHIFLSPDIMLSDNITGLINAIPTMKRTHMYLKMKDRNMKTNASLRKVEATLFKSMTTWMSLVHIFDILRLARFADWSSENRFRGRRIRRCAPHSAAPGIFRCHCNRVKSLRSGHVVTVRVRELLSPTYPGMLTVEEVLSLVAIRVDEMRQPFHDIFFKTLAANLPLRKLELFKDNPYVPSVCV